MAPKRGKRVTKKEQGTSGQTKKRGRKTKQEQMMKIIDAYMEGNLKEVRDRIPSWERDLRENLRYRDIPMDEWERMVLDPRTTNGRQSLFKQTMH